MACNTIAHSRAPFTHDRQHRDSKRSRIRNERRTALAAKRAFAFMAGA